MNSYENGKKYKCVANCPELDLEHHKHCVLDGETLNSDEYCVNDCPCGNHTKWVDVYD